MLKGIKGTITMEIMTKQFCRNFSLNFVKDALQDDNQICQVHRLG